MQTADIIFQLIILFFSAIIHEVSHGYAALFQGDATAKYENRLTLNPFRHIDPIGSVVLPLALFLGFAGHPPFMFGWAKPVPFNPYNLRNRRWGEAIVAVAGPAANILIALVFGTILRFGAPYIPDPAVAVVKFIVVINIMLAFFNLMPIPPLDGSKVLFAFLPARASRLLHGMEKFSVFFVLIFVFFFWDYVSPVIGILFQLLTGMSF